MSLVSALEAPLGIANAIRKASRATGADFNYLLKTAARESAFNESAKAKTSSAVGLFQFIESTWLEMVKEVGGKFGLDKYTPHIFTTRSGKYYVPNESLRREILELRQNPEISAMMAGEFTQQNSEFVAGQLGREPSAGELYIAHFLGAKGASDLISLAQTKPNARADRYFPQAARANRAIFYSGGRARSMEQVYKNLVSHHARLQATAAGQPAAASRVADAGNAKAASPTGPSALVHNASLKQPPPSANAAAPLGDPAVEAKLIEAASAQDAIGILGQRGSPIAPPAKIAPLSVNSLKVKPGAFNGTERGSAGLWETLVQPNAGQAMEKETAAAQPSNAERQEAREKRRASRRVAESQPQRVLEQSARRESAPTAVRSASRGGAFGGHGFWHRMSLNGG